MRLVVSLVVALMIVVVAGCAGDASNATSTTLSDELVNTTTSSSADSTLSDELVSTTTSSIVGSQLSLVVIGDSIPYNSPDDCPGCDGFASRYADAASEALGMPVLLHNRAQHTGLTLEGLLDELNRFEAQLKTADLIIVAIAHNSSELAADMPCGTPFAYSETDWSAFDGTCAMRSTEKYGPMFDSLFTQIASLREGKPTAFRTINRYNDLIGWDEVTLSKADEASIKLVLDEWNEMLCGSAIAHGFVCADIYHAFNGPDGLTPSGDLLGADYTHPSDKGNEVIAKILNGLGFAPLA